MKKILLSILVSSVIGMAFAQKIPPTNLKIIKYIDSKMGKKVDRGECWDLANQSLLFANAQLPDLYVFGKEIIPSKDKIFPGDMLQFSGVNVEYIKSGVTYYESMQHHTAIVYKVIDKNKFILAEQNGSAGRKVDTIPFDLTTVKSGKIKFYRPISN